MSSTEQKNVSQPFISACHTFGILPTILTSAFDNFSLDTDREPFHDLGPTPHLGRRLRSSPDPVSEARRLFPVLDRAGGVTPMGPLLLRLCSDSAVFIGNHAVLRFVESIASCRWNVHIADTAAIKHARRHCSQVCAFMAPGAYGQVVRSGANARRLNYRKEASYYRTAADCFDFMSRGPRHKDHHRGLSIWLKEHRSSFGFAKSYRTTSKAYDDYRKFDPKTVHGLPLPPPVKQKWITIGRTSRSTFAIYHWGSTYFIKVTRKHWYDERSTLCDPKKTPPSPPVSVRPQSELYVLSHRDLQDMVFMFNAIANIKHYFTRRQTDVGDMKQRQCLVRLQTRMWGEYLSVMRNCGWNHELRNKLGVYFDVLQWRYLAWRSGDIFYNHSFIMAQKIKSKGLERLPDQMSLLNTLKSAPIDLAIDVLGMYKASIYPEVDPFQVVSDQYALHMKRHVTNWQPGTAEHLRFQETRAYMWYLGTRVIFNKHSSWPGRIRDGASPKKWHADYKSKGIPGEDWRDACDVDLTNAIPVADISEEQYMKQADSACAPPLWEEYANYDRIAHAPKRHRRKLLYAIQEPCLINLEHQLMKMNEAGRAMPDGYVGESAIRMEFSTDIVTGSRCERHKDAPRPFYAASPPWGCIVSYFDGLARDFLNGVPQSMLGKSTRQKFMDLSSIGSIQDGQLDTFYMSDDKAKYSPHMDPESQQMPAEFFAEIFGIPAIRAMGPIMYHNELYYRVHGHLVHYNSNGTDREGMRGASNTWLEIVAQGLSTRLCRESGLVASKSIFLSFIDDGLRKFAVNTRKADATEILKRARLIIDDVIFGLKVLGRELSWDKTFISRDLFVILNEIVYDGSFVSSGLKSYCTAGDIEIKEVMTASDYEQLYFGKMRGAHGVGTPLDLAHQSYVFETLMSHYKMGVCMQDNAHMSNLDYRLFCMTPLAFGGAGLRSQIQMCCTEVANSTKEGIGNLLRLASDYGMVAIPVGNILNHPLEPIGPVDFMREPEQVHVAGPRVKTQRLAAEVRRRLGGIAGNAMSRKYVELDTIGMRVLRELGNTFLAIGDVSAEEVRLMYSCSPVAFIDEFIQKLASSMTLSELLDKSTVAALRRSVRRDLVQAANYFGRRTRSRELIQNLSSDLDKLALIGDLMR